METFGHFLTSNHEIDFFSKNSKKEKMTSRKNEIDFFSKNSTNKRNMTSREKIFFTL